MIVFFLKCIRFSAATLLAFASIITAAQAITLRFVHNDIEGGGNLSVQVVVNDLDGDGVIVANNAAPNSELISLSARLTGNSVLPDFDINPSNLDEASIIYKLGTPFLGDDYIPDPPAEFGEFLFFNDFRDDQIVEYDLLGSQRSGLIGDLPGFAYTLIGDPTSGEVLFEEFIELNDYLTLAPIPLPAPIYLLAVGLAALFVPRRKSSTQIA